MLESLFFPPELSISAPLGDQAALHATHRAAPSASPPPHPASSTASLLITTSSTASSAGVHEDKNGMTAKPILNILRIFYMLLYNPKTVRCST